MRYARANVVYKIGDCTNGVTERRQIAFGTPPIYFVRSLQRSVSLLLERTLIVTSKYL